MTKKDQPIACDLTVFSAATRKQLAATVPDLFHTVENVEELPDGYAFHFPNEPGAFMALANFVEHERQCCPFFHFEIEVAPHGGPFRLRMTGVEGVKEYMQNAWQDVLE